MVPEKLLKKLEVQLEVQYVNTFEYEGMEYVWLELKNPNSRVL